MLDGTGDAPGTGRGGRRRPAWRSVYVRAGRWKVMRKAGKRCGECGIPLGVGRNLNWNEDGTITHRRNPRHRLILFESDNLDRLWNRLSELLGVTLEHVWEVVIESKSRATRAFLQYTLPWKVSLAARLLGYRSIIRAIEVQGLEMGYGKITLGGQYPERGRPQRITVYIEDPYSLPLFCGDLKGSAEVLERRWSAVTYQALDARRHQVDVTVSGEVLEREAELPALEPLPVPGDFAYRRCSRCGSPLELGRFEWNLETGVIREKETGRRVALFGTAGLKAVFEELTHELGDRVLPTIVEVERDNTLSAMTREEVMEGGEALRLKAALRGLGLVRRLSIREGRMEAEILNPAVTPYLVGLALGVFELAVGRRGEYTAEEREGRLFLTVC